MSLADSYLFLASTGHYFECLSKKPKQQQQRAEHTIRTPIWPLSASAIVTLMASRTFISANSSPAGQVMIVDTFEREEQYLAAWREANSLIWVAT